MSQFHGRDYVSGAGSLLIYLPGVCIVLSVRGLVVDMSSTAKHLLRTTMTCGKCFVIMIERWFLCALRYFHIAISNRNVGCHEPKHVILKKYVFVYDIASYVSIRSRIYITRVISLYTQKHILNSSIYSPLIFLSSNIASLPTKQRCSLLMFLISPTSTTACNLIVEAKSWSFRQSIAHIQYNLRLNIQ